MCLSRLLERPITLAIEQSLVVIRASSHGSDVPIRHADDVTTLDQGSVPPRRRCSSP